MDLKFAEKLFDRASIFLIVAGAVFLLFSFTGGITFSAFLPLKDDGSRWGAAAAGIFCMAAGIWLELRSSAGASPAALRVADYGIEITAPHDGDDVEYANVHGTMTGRLPQGHLLRIFRTTPGSSHLTPLGAAVHENGSNKWLAERCHAAGKPGDRRILAAFIVGPDGQALVDYYEQAAAAQKRMWERLKAADSSAGDIEYITPLPRPTADMYECARVWVRRPDAAS